MSFTEIVKESGINVEIHKNNFERGFFYFFGLTNNPFDKAVKDIYFSNLGKSLSKDWENVSKDFNKVFTQEIEKIDVKE